MRQITGAGEPSSRSSNFRYFFLAAFFLGAAFFLAAFFLVAMCLEFKWLEINNDSKNRIIIQTIKNFFHNGATVMLITSSTPLNL